jgi:branched-subunit amino acid ABC-type transport system permease component
VAEIVNTLYLALFSIGLFVLISLGLAVIFGLMRVINLAQGEFIMLGAYVCALTSNRGVPLWVAFLLAAIAVGLFGVLVERLIIRWLYGRIVDTLLATWGLSLFLVGGITTLFGPQAESVGAAIGNLRIAGVTISLYNMIVIAIALLMLALTFALLRFTTFGLLVRGTMQNPEMAAALGVPRERIYMLTFGLGSALTGLAGAVLVPITGVSPTMGVFFVAKAFITVIAGGQLPLLGTISAATLFGAIDGVVSFRFSSVVGEISVLLVAILLLRLLPLGITGRLRQGL